MNENKNNEKLEKLKEIYSDKSRSREERHQALEDIAWETYRNDPKPAMSLRKYKMYDGFLYIADALLFLYMALADTITPKIGIWSTPLTICLAMILAISAVIYILKRARYKVEPEDDLAMKNSSKATAKAYIWILTILAVVLLLYTFISENALISMKASTMIYYIVSLVFIHSGLASFLFIAEEGKIDGEE